MFLLVVSLYLLIGLILATYTVKNLLKIENKKPETQTDYDALSEVRFTTDMFGRERLHILAFVAMLLFWVFFVLWVIFNPSKG